MLKPRLTRYSLAGVPYEVVRLYDGTGSFQDWLVHVLVLSTFVGPRPDGMEVRHLDGNSLNNSLENLAWGTHKENTQDAFVHGSFPNLFKTHCPYGHEYTPQNTYVGKSASGGKSRTCKRCRADREAQRRLRKAGAILLDH